MNTQLGFQSSAEDWGTHFVPSTEKTWCRIVGCLFKCQLWDILFILNTVVVLDRYRPLKTIVVLCLTVLSSAPSEIRPCSCACPVFRQPMSHSRVTWLTTPPWLAKEVSKLALKPNSGTEWSLAGSLHGPTAGISSVPALLLHLADPPSFPALLLYYPVCSRPAPLHGSCSDSDGLCSNRKVWPVMSWFETSIHLSKHKWLGISCFGCLRPQIILTYITIG